MLRFSKYIAIAFFVSASLLMAQVTVTRLLAYRLYYHYVFLVISLAQMGLAGAGAWIYARQKCPDVVQLRGWMLALSVLPVATLAYYSWFSPAPNLAFAKVDGPPAYLYMSVISVFLVAINFCGGMVLVSMFQTFKERIGALYGADLAGAAAGCVASVALMKYADPPFAFIAAGGLVALASTIAPGRPRVGIGAASALVLVVVALLGRDFLDPNIRFRDSDLRIAQVVRSDWNHLGRVDAEAPGRYVIDGDASTDFWDRSSARLAPGYRLVRPRPDVAIIGVGAGPQLRIAHEQGARSVLAIDINPIILGWAEGVDASATRELFRQPNVHTRIGDGRHVLRSSTESFDLIVMHAVDTWTASAQGAYSLTENFLYTVESVRDMLSRLRPGGVVSISRWLFWPPRENLRLFSTVLEALEEAGVQSPADSVVVLSPTRDYEQPDLQVWGYVLFSNQPYPPELLARLDDAVERAGYAYLYRPHRVLATPFLQYAAADRRREFALNYPYDISPSRDSNPFFFQFTSPLSQWKTHSKHVKGLYGKSSRTLLVALVLVVGLAVWMLGVPLMLRRKDLRGDPLSWWSPVYFGCLGLGFMAVELPVIQISTLFLGHPTYAISFVLMGLLAFAGIGSAIAGRIPHATRNAVFPAIVLLILAAQATLLGAAHALIDLPDWARFSILIAVLAVIGIPLGMPFVLGIRSLDPARPHQVAWAWAINGLLGVLGSVFVMMIIVFSTSRTALLVAAGCYALAFVVLARMSRLRAAT